MPNIKGLEGIITAGELLQLIDEQQYVPKIVAQSRKNAHGPSNWDNITDGDFGRFFDFSIEPLNDLEKIVYAQSEAALQWCYKFLPADMPRYRSHGFVITNDYIDSVIRRMERAGLIDEQTYFEDMSQRGQWGDEG